MNKNPAKYSAFLLVESLVSLSLLTGSVWICLDGLAMYQQAKQRLELEIKMEDGLYQKLKVPNEKVTVLAGDKYVEVYYEVDEHCAHVWVDYKGKRYEYLLEK